MAEDEHVQTDPKSAQKIDTVHQDEAMKVLATYEGEQTWTMEEERRVRRKIDWRLMPVLCLTYGLQYYDKAMLSQAVRGLFPESFRSEVLIPLSFCLGSVWTSNRSRP